MHIFAHVIVDKHVGYWTASFIDVPQIGYCGPDPTRALLQLISACGEDLNSEEIIVIDGASHEGHLEFLIPHYDRIRIPRPSAN